MIRLALLFGLLATAAHAEIITLASTTSVENSGLLARILPSFTQTTGITVKVVALGTGQALALAACGDADLVLVHDPDAEATFAAAGHVHTRREIAWNDFLLVGPASDPAHINGTHNAALALHAIASQQTPFISRGDASGTDAMEKRLWRRAQITPFAPWYKEIGGGMGAALNMAAALDAITLTDRGTWLAFSNRRTLIELVSGDPVLINRYDVIELNPSQHPNINAAAAARLADWLTSPAGQAAIGDYQLAGEQLFHPSAVQILPKP